MKPVKNTVNNFTINFNNRYNNNKIIKILKVVKMTMMIIVIIINVILINNILITLHINYTHKKLHKEIQQNIKQDAIRHIKMNIKLIIIHFFILCLNTKLL